MLLVCATGLAQAAESPVTIHDLTLRADAGERSAMRALADAYYAGQQGAEQDFTRAADWYRRLAQAGDARAQTSLGLMYAQGYGVARNLGEARRWWSHAAAQNDPGAQYNLGLGYARGDGVDADPVLAARWFREAAQRGHVQAQYNLGLLLHEGKGIARNPPEAYYWISIAAMQGDERAAHGRAAAGAALDDAQRRDAELRARDWLSMRQRRAD